LIPDFSASREAVSRAGGATRYLIALSLGLMVALVGAFFHLSSRQKSMEDSIREDALWAVYQLDREARTLSEKLANARETSDSATLNGLTIRYDILYSRLSILDNGKYAPYFEQNDRVNAHRARIDSIVFGIEPFFNDLARGKALDAATLEAIRKDLPELLQVTNDLLVFTNTSVTAARADARVSIMRLQNLAALFVAALAVTIGLLVLNLTRQLAMMRRASVDLERMTVRISEAYSAAEAGNRAKSEFMATIGHEIRTPLNAILGMAELLSRARLSAENRYSVDVITSSGTALLEVINEILDFAKLEHGDTPPETVPYDAGAMIAEATRIMEGRAREQGNTLSSSCGIQGGTWFYGDPARLRRVVLNLVSNAVKFTENGAVHVSARTIRGSGGRPSLRFEVSDTGIGIPQDARHRLFNAFSQVDGTISRRYGGTGLGLAICKRIVESLGGEIGVESEPGMGSLFWFEVPANPAPAQATRPETRPDPDALPRLAVLLVEDNLVNRQVATSFLESLGQSVTIAVDGAEALAKATEHVYDLILMDMQMPVLDGIAATRAIRKLAGDAGRVPIVAMTANASDSDRKLCLEAGMNGFESKPIGSARLARIIADHAFDRQSVGADAAGPAAAAEDPALDVVANAEPAGRDGATVLADRDEDRVAELVDAVGQDGFEQLLDVFFADSSALLSDLHRAMQSNDPELFDRSLHSLKGSASNLGFRDVAQLAEDLRRVRLSEASIARVAAAIAQITGAYARRAA
jgi:signal transduction histidine kinase/DNA-binding NarL/FixJ family response regulator/HPt (histidine-containing phosphotransfer) domain-containing protein